MYSTYIVLERERERKKRERERERERERGIKGAKEMFIKAIEFVAQAVI